jgi:hypothetical protein
MRAQHSRYRAMLSALMDGELSDDSRRELDRHLSACPSCERTLEDFRHLREMGSTAKPFPANPFYLTRIKAALDRSSATAWGVSEIEAKLFGPLLAILVLAIILLFSVTERESPATPDEYFFGGQKTVVEQQLLLRSEKMSKEEVLMLTSLSHTREERSRR